MRLHTCRACLDGRHEKCERDRGSGNELGGSSCLCRCRGRGEKRWRSDEKREWRARIKRATAKGKSPGKGLMVGQGGQEIRPCKPGTHDFVWDVRQNRHHIDGGKVKGGPGYYSCARCGDLAGSAHDTESWVQTISRIEREREKEYKTGLRRFLKGVGHGKHKG